MPNAPATLDILRSHPIFGVLPAAMIERLGRYVTKRAVRRGASIFAKGDPGNSLLAVMSGSVRISIPAADGREAVLNTIHPGEIFGEIALLDGRPRTADAVAATDCELMVIERRDFIPFVQQNPEVALKLIEVLCMRLRRTTEQVEDVMFLNLPGRLAKTLLQLVERSGGKLPCRLSITQRELGQIIGMSRESTNKQLRAWETRDWLRLERGGVLVLATDPLADISELQFEPDLG